MSATLPRRKRIGFHAVLWGGMVILMLPVLFVGFYRWDSSRNRGFHFGYWGDFNRVEHALGSLPGLRVDRSYANKDVVIEEFGFVVAQGSRTGVDLFIAESDPIRQMSGDRLREELRSRIEAAR